MSVASSELPGSTPPARKIISNVSWTLGAQIFSMAAAVLTIPFRVTAMGLERYGVMGLAWAVIGYLSLFDLGLERAVNQAIASRTNSGKSGEIPRVFWTALTLMTMLGVAAAAIGIAMSSWLVTSVFAIPEALHRETIVAFWLLALTLPFQMMGAGFSGALESVHRFDLTSKASITLTFFTYVAPVIVLLVTQNLVAIAACALIGRILLLAIVGISAYRVFAPARQYQIPDRNVLRLLLKTGGWMNLISLLHPLMTTIDRLIIGAVVSLTAVSFYTVPYDSATKLWVIPLAMAGVLFPIFSDAVARNDSRRVRLFVQGLRFSFLSILPISLGMAIFAWDGLNIWIGAELANGGGRVLQILAIGICANAFGHIPFVLIQGAGRSDLIAKLQLVELPIYVPLVFVMANLSGIEGIAWIWMARNIVDSAGLYLLSLRFVGEPVRPLPYSYLLLSAVLFGGALLLFRADLELKIVFAVASIGTLAVIAWFRILAAEERAMILGLLTRFQRVPGIRHFRPST